MLPCIGKGCLRQCNTKPCKRAGLEPAVPAVLFVQSYAKLQSVNSTTQVSLCTALKEIGGASCAKKSMPSGLIHTSALRPSMRAHSGVAVHWKLLCTGRGPRCVLLEFLQGRVGVAEKPICAHRSEEARQCCANSDRHRCYHCVAVLLARAGSCSACASLLKTPTLMQCQCSVVKAKRKRRYRKTSNRGFAKVCCALCHA